jgi:ADP-ribose pyrophosphatase
MTKKNVDTLRISNRTSVFRTPWFELVQKGVAGNSVSHYSIRTRDYVCVFAITRDKTFLLVRQFRPAIEMFTLELPSGHVGEGETPEQSARKELLEETGFVAEEVTLLGTLAPDSGRLDTRLWCFFAAGVWRNPAIKFDVEYGIEPIIYKKSLRDLVLNEPSFPSALNRAAILTAEAKGLVKM